MTFDQTNSTTSPCWQITNKTSIITQTEANKNDSKKLEKNLSFSIQKENSQTRNVSSLQRGNSAN